MTIAPPVPRLRCSVLTATPYRPRVNAPRRMNEFEGERARGDHFSPDVVGTGRISFEFVRWEDGSVDADSEIDDRPLYSRRRRTVMRVVVLVAVGAMLLPIFASLISVSSATAANACARAVAYAVPDADGSSARFELFGAGFIGWECYAVGGFGGTHHVISLGLIPGKVDLPRGVNS